MENDDLEFQAELQAKGLNAELVTQPANSPDTNLLDLGFFHAVQSANDQVARGQGEIIKHVKQAYVCYLLQLINQTWLTFMSCLNMIIKDLGDNDYEIPHMNKAKMEQEGRLPTVLDVTDAAAPLMETMDATDPMVENEMSDDNNDSETQTDRHQHKRIPC